MKPNCIFALFAVLLSFAAPVRAQNTAPIPAQRESLTAIFTNAGHFASMPPRRASIIFIALHGLGFGDLSCYGQTNFQTPNFDRLATEGTRFTNYRVTSDGLAQVQAALMAGNNAPFPPGGPTLATWLQQSGYRTGLIGEWMLGSQPHDQGFYRFTGFLSEQEARYYYSDFVWTYIPKVIYDETNHTLSDFAGREEVHDNTGGRKNRYMPDVLMDAMVNFVKENQPDFSNRYRPFFLLLNLPAPESVTPGKDDFQVPTDAPFNSENWPQAARNRAALMTRLDADMGRLFEQLNKMGMSNSVAIFLAGAVAPAPFADPKMNFLKLKDEVRGGNSEDRLRVPMLVRWTGHVPAGRVCPAPWDTTDFAPTVLQIAYTKPPTTFTGTSILPVLLNKPTTDAPGMTAPLRK